MALFDKFTRVAENKDLTGAGLVGLFFSNAYDLDRNTQSLRDIGRGATLSARCQVTEAFVSAAGATLLWQVVVASNDDSGFFNLSPVFLIRSPTTPAFVNLAAADLTLGAEWILPIPPIPMHQIGTVPGRRYMGVIWGLGDANTFTAGKMTVDIGVAKEMARPNYFRTGFTGP